MIEFRNDAKKCPMCLGPAGRDTKTELSGRVGSNEDHPRWSYSMGLTEADAKEILKKHPELESDFKYGKFGGPLRVHNRQDKLQKIKIFGMEEY